jgi:peptidoglycan/xylan/chitin deacetylase (PgdA/CDA1 family)
MEYRGRDLLRAAVVRLGSVLRLPDLYIRHGDPTRALILAYHRLIPGELYDAHSRMPGLYVTVTAFRDQMEWLRARFDVLPLAELIEGLRESAQWRRPVCAVTFDDGWRDNFEHAYPILRRMELPATVFLVGDITDELQPMFWHVCYELFLRPEKLPDAPFGDPVLDAALRNGRRLEPNRLARQLIRMIRELPFERFTDLSRRIPELYFSLFDYDTFRRRYSTVTRPEVREMSRGGISFGYHSRSHFMLPRLPEPMKADEIAFPAFFSDPTINSCRVFCYPDGKHDAPTVETVARSGYMGAVGLSPGFNSARTNPFSLRRATIHEGISPIPDFSLRVTLGNR